MVMKTDNIYIARLGYSTKVDIDGTLYDYYFGDGMKHIVNYVPIKYVIVKKETNGSKKAKDLETGKKYMCKLPTNAGTLYLPQSKMLPFDAIYPEEKANLSKKKILTLGKQAIKEFEKIESEQKKK